MKKIEINNVWLDHLHVVVNNQRKIPNNNNNQMLLDVEYSLQDNCITYHIALGESKQESPFHMQCTYRFIITHDNASEEEIIKAIMKRLKPRIEELVNVISIETTFTKMI